MVFGNLYDKPAPSNVIIPMSRSGALSRRVSRLSKKMKLQNPSHLLAVSLPDTFDPVSTTGYAYNPSQAISQGDDYDERFGSSIYATRLIMKGVLHAGSSASGASTVRISVFRAASTYSFASNMTVSYSPIVTNTVSQLIYDRFYDIPASNTANGFGVPVHLNLKLKHKQKFNGTGGAASVGDCIWVVCQSGTASGSNLNPVWACGILEYYFQPL